MGLLSLRNSSNHHCCLTSGKDWVVLEAWVGNWTPDKVNSWSNPARLFLGLPHQHSFLSLALRVLSTTFLYQIQESVQCSGWSAEFGPRRLECQSSFSYEVYRTGRPQARHYMSAKPSSQGDHPELPGGRVEYNMKNKSHCIYSKAFVASLTISAIKIALHS